MSIYKGKRSAGFQSPGFGGQLLPDPKGGAPASTYFSSPGIPGPVLSQKARECSLLKDSCLCLFPCLVWLSVSQGEN